MLKITFIPLVFIVCLYRSVFADSSSCGNPPRIKNGYPVVGNITHPESNHGAVVTYICRSNRVLVERGKVECYFGQWRGDLPECKDVNDDHAGISSAPSPHHYGTNSIGGSCGDPPRIKNGFPIVGNKTHPGRNHGAVVTYFCRGNKVLVERGKVECQSGQWVGNAPECKGIGDDHTNNSSTATAPSLTSPHHNGRNNIGGNCGVPPRVRNGYPIVGNRTHPGRNHGAVVTYVCRGNKVLVERGKVECQFGQWVGNAPECKDSSCGDPPRIKNGFPIVGNETHPESNHGAVVTYHCRDNKVLVETGKVECSYGKWVGVPPECKDIDDVNIEISSIMKASNPAPPQRGNRRKNMKGLCIKRKLVKYIGLKRPAGKFLNSTSFEIKCRKGYKPSNAGESITCLNGKWIVPKTICIEDVEHDDFIGGSSVARQAGARLHKIKNKKKNKSTNNSAKNETFTT